MRTVEKFHTFLLVSTPDRVDDTAMEFVALGWLSVLALVTYAVYRLCVAVQGASR